MRSSQQLPAIARRSRTSRTPNRKNASSLNSPNSNVDIERHNRIILATKQVNEISFTNRDSSKPHGKTRMGIISFIMFIRCPKIYETFITTLYAEL